MTKHVIDKPKDRSEIKAREYMRLEREEGPHRATKQLHARGLAPAARRGYASSCGSSAVARPETCVSVGVRSAG